MEHMHRMQHSLVNQGEGAIQLLLAMLMVLQALEELEELEALAGEL